MGRRPLVSVGSLLVALALVAGCQQDGARHEASDPDETTVEIPVDVADTPTAEPVLSPQEIVQHPRSDIVGVLVEPLQPGYRVTTVWHHLRSNLWAVTVHRRGEPTRYRAASRREADRLLWADEQLGRSCAAQTGGRQLCLDVGQRPPRLTLGPADDDTAVRELRVTLPRGLNHAVAPSMSDSVVAVVSGGDGATLHPFQTVTVSRDGGGTWQQHALPLFRGERAYTAGSVVLTDGRLLTALEGFGSDRAHHRLPVRRGLWVSTNDDWTAFEPFDALPALRTPPGELGTVDSLGVASDRGPAVLWILGVDGRLHLSTDGHSFREVDLRS